MRRPNRAPNRLLQRGDVIAKIDAPGLRLECKAKIQKARRRHFCKICRAADAIHRGDHYLNIFQPNSSLRGAVCEPCCTQHARITHDEAGSIISRAIDALQEAGRLSKDDAEQAQHAIRREQQR